MTTIKLRRGTAAEWSTSNPVLNDGEVGFERDTNKHKIGDGVTAWNALAYFVNETVINNNFIGKPGNGDGVGTVPTKQSDGSISYIVPAASAQARTLGSGNYKAGTAKVLQPVWAALAKRNSAAFDLVHQGTSLWAGTGATDGSARLPEQLLTHMRRRFPVVDTIGGVGYRAGSGTYGGPSSTGTATAVNEGLGNRATQLLASGDSVAYASLTGTTITIYGTAHTAGDSINYDIDAGTTTGTITPGVTGRFSQVIAVPRSTQHTLTITWAAGSPTIRGINIQDGDETVGIRAWDCSKGGAKVGDWQTAYGGSQDWLADIGSGGIVDPDLVIIDSIANDAGNISAATWGIRMQALVNLWRTKTTAPIVLWMAHRRNPAVLTPVSPWTDYTAQAYAVASASTYVTVIDMDPLVDIATVGTDWLFDTYHPTNYGYAALAAITFEELFPTGTPEGTAQQDSPYTVNRVQEQVRGSMRVYGRDKAVVPFRIVPAPSPTVDLFEIVSADKASRYLLVDSSGRTIVSQLTARGKPDGSSSSGFTVDANAGQIRDLSWSTTTGEGATPSPRWTMRTDGTAESGSNAGSSFLFIARDDTGGTLKTIFSVLRNTWQVTWGDAVNFAFGSTTGTKIGTAATQKIGFYGKTPIVQPASTPAAATDAATTQTLVNDLRTKLINLGLIV